MDYLFILLAPIVHEAAHFIAAKLAGTSIKFEFSTGKLGPIPIPRYTWKWPDVSKKKLRFICQSEFVAELALVPFLPWQYQAAALLHFAIYPWYAGDVSDFNGF